MKHFTILEAANLTNAWRSQRRKLLRASIALLGILAVSPAVFGEDEDEYIYCQATGGDSLDSWDSMHYTAIFRGDYSASLGYKNDFHDYLDAHQPERYFAHIYCFFGRTRKEASERLLRDVKKDRQDGLRVVRTNWTPSKPEGEPTPTRSPKSSFEQPSRPDTVSLLSIPNQPSEQPGGLIGHHLPLQGEPR